MIQGWVWAWALPRALRALEPMSNYERALAARCVAQWFLGYLHEPCRPYIDRLVQRCPAAQELARLIWTLKNQDITFGELMRLIEPKYHEYRRQCAQPG